MWNQDPIDTLLLENITPAGRVRNTPASMRDQMFDAFAKSCREIWGFTTMNDTTIKKVDSAHSPLGEMGQKYLVSGKRLSMRLWEAEPKEAAKEATEREYETVGYVIAGRAELESEGQFVTLEPGDSWLVPMGAKHRYKIIEPFTAVEATAPPAQVHARD